MCLALCLPVLASAIAVTLDYAELVRRRSDLQIAADSAALAAVRALASSTASTDAEKEQEASARATQVVDGKAAYAQKAVAAQAGQRTVSVNLSFAKAHQFATLLGMPATTLAVESQATYSETPVGCIVALGQTGPAGISLIGSASFTATRCAIWSNASGTGSITTQGAAKITGRVVCAVGDGRRASASPPARSSCESAPDPYAGRELKCGRNQSVSCQTYKPSPGDCLKTNYSVPKSKDPVQLEPGIYCGGITIEKADAVMQPGLYQIVDGPLSLQNHAALSGTGVTIVLVGANAVLDLQGTPKIQLSAMTTGPTAGIAIASATQTSPPLVSKLQGNGAVTLNGSLWLPDQVLDMQGNPTLTLTGATDKALAYGFAVQGNPELIVKADDRLEQQASIGKLRLSR